MSVVKNAKMTLPKEVVALMLTAHQKSVRSRRQFLSVHGDEFVRDGGVGCEEEEPTLHCPPTLCAPKFSYGILLSNGASADVSTFGTPRRMARGSKGQWPHALGCYKACGASNEALVESRGIQKLRFEMFDIKNASKPAAVCYDEVIAEINKARITFKLTLVYDDDDEEVTLGNLNGNVGTKITQLSFPNVIGCGTYAFRDGFFACPL